jgi:hypothetical protein
VLETGIAKASREAALVALPDNADALEAAGLSE